MKREQISRIYYRHFKDVEGYYKDKKGVGYVKLDERLIDFIDDLMNGEIEEGDDDFSVKIEVEVPDPYGSWR